MHSSRWFLDDALARYHRTGHTVNEAGVLITLGRETEAIPLLEDVPSEGWESPLYTLERQRLLADAYRAAGRPDLGLRALQRFVELKDYLHSTKSASTLSIGEARFTAQVQMQQEAELRRQQEADIMQTARQRDQRQYSLLGLILMLVILGVVFTRNRQTLASRERLIGVLTALLAFEYLLLLSESFSEDLTNGEPLYMYGTNILLALLILPLHHGFEGWLTSKR